MNDKVNLNHDQTRPVAIGDGRGHRRCDARAFTLIELLVVISIIAMLVSLALPVVGRSREIARRAICMGNLRQIFVSVESYGTDNHGYYPGVFGLGQSQVNGDSSLSCCYNNSWIWEANMAFTLAVDKGITLCPSQDPWDATKQWINLGTEANPAMFGTTDYAMKASFGSNHIAVTSTGYDDPSPANFGSFRGMYDFRFPHAGKGYALNYRQEQPRWWNDPSVGQQTNSIMFMDRSRSPAVSAQDGTQYQMKRSNHANANNPGAEVINVVLKSGQIRAMNMNAVWGKADYSMNYYDMSGYGEGGYAEYVDDEIARYWW